VKPVQLILGVHLHQPVGNFPEVLEESYQRAYRPFLEVFREFSELRLVWHCSGFLFQWLCDRHPDYVAILRDLVRQGRVEPLTGGVYEPIFPVIPARDRQEQIRRLSALVRRALDFEPRGLWLAERVWEPEMAGDLQDAGIQYVSLDDYHFFAAGAAPGDLDGYFTVEDLDRSVAVFPISEPMRYLIPWAEADRVLDEFRRLREQGTRLAVMMDDAEKFGSWPDTHRWVYERNWLRDFFRLVQENPDVVTMTTFQQYWQENRPLGRAALPGASYAEMGQWALPPGRSAEYESWRNRFEKDGIYQQLKPFFRGGIWRNFLVKYPEAHYLHKRTLWLSRAFDSKEKRKLPAYDHLLQAQCNDVYWHGVFGGLYLPHLRQAAFAHLLSAQTELEDHEGREFADGAVFTREDLDLDREDELLLNHREYFAVIVPARGGAFQELSLKRPPVNLLNNLARWQEKYHLTASNQRVVRIGEGDEHSSGEPIRLQFDHEPRLSCRERLFGEIPPLENLEFDTVTPLVSFWDRRFTIASFQNGAARLEWAGDGFSLAKEVASVSVPAGLDIAGELRAVEPTEGWIAVEWTLGIAGGQDPEKCCYPPGDRLAARGLGQPGVWDGVAGLTVENRRDGYIVDFVCSEKVAVRYWPIETVSLAIDTMEKTYQGFCICFFFPWTGDSANWGIQIRFRKPAA
jgi:hypothetical protein